MGEDVDMYVARFKTLVWKAGYNLGDNMILEVFTDRLPVGLYEQVFTIIEPQTYKGWR